MAPRLHTKRMSIQSGEVPQGVLTVLMYALTQCPISGEHYSFIEEEQV